MNATGRPGLKRRACVPRSTASSSCLPTATNPSPFFPCDGTGRPQTQMLILVRRSHPHPEAPQQCHPTMGQLTPRAATEASACERAWPPQFCIGSNPLSRRHSTTPPPPPASPSRMGVVDKIVQSINQSINQSVRLPSLTVRHAPTHIHLNHTQGSFLRLLPTPAGGWRTERGGCRVVERRLEP